MRLNIYIIGTILLFLPLLVSARGAAPVEKNSENRKFKRDSIIVAKQSAEIADSLSLSAEERNRRFYDTLAVRSEKTGFGRFIYKMLIVPKSDPTEGKEELVDEEAKYGVFDGATISGIEFDRYNVFERAVSYLEKAMNAVHVVSRENTIRKDLMFGVGDRVDAEVFVQTKQLLKSRDYIYDADFIVTPDPDDSTAVNIKVVTHDSWTISVDGGFVGLTGRVSGDIYDANLLGTGNRLKYKLSLDWKNKNYQGSLFEYRMPNIFGTFFEGRFVAGRSFWETTYSGAVNKKFIRNSDYEAGAILTFRNTSIHMPALQRSAKINYREGDVWLGGSHYIPSINSSIYGLGRFYNVKYFDRPPETEQGVHPQFHNRSLYLASMGLYREKFLTSSLIYGYGFDEYIARGYRTEVVLGYMDAEYDPGFYGGFSFKLGDFTPVGYFTGEISLGSYFANRTMKPYRSALNMRVDYFTNLLGKGRTRWRQFLSLNYTAGWNRQQGWQEVISFTRESGPRLFPESPAGTNRMTFNTETVVFTPWQPIGFRIAIYGFADIGLLGHNANIFKNQFYSTIGLGIRMRNEMLVFSTIQINLCVSFDKTGFLKNNDWFILNEGRRMDEMRYIPSKPLEVWYR